ncbi:MAG: bifunctional folylpolyglutamate synthase/dihydrofolate synthase [Candidatus Omnitrophica bacterium]|nr:bifunctional folylpolyglutamate synthase/dihydrofolate synthase [Candidatus Omnitrophota bacterium]
MTNVSPHEYLHSLTNFESTLHKVTAGDFHLGRVFELLSALGAPQQKLKVIHVAGTKGKGSTCAMIASILQQAGLKVGLYTSPHLHRVNERIRILDQSHLHSADDFAGSISDDQLARTIGIVRPAVAAIENKGVFLTYFEVLTAIAAVYFVKENVDFVVLETGLGGRLDATNAFDSQIAVITPISLDHTKILGNGLKQIASEKAGIIKNSRQKVVIAPQEVAVMEVLKGRCGEFGIEPQVIHPTQYQHLKPALKGDHQMINAACALGVVDYLKQQGVPIGQEELQEGLKKVRWLGRFEVVKEKPTVVVDGAHNPASSTALAKTVLDEYPRRRVILVLGLSVDKDIKAVCEPLKLISEKIILTKANHPRSHVFNRQEAHDIFAGKEWFLTENVADALSLALAKAQKEDVIVVTGSLFVAGEARACINSKA